MKTLSLLVVLLFLLFCFSALSYRNTVFGDSTAYCCENALCENTNPAHGPYCSSISTAYYEPDGCETELTINCATCVTWTLSHCLCDGGGSDYCINQDGSFYYGTIISCDSHNK